MKEKIYTSFLKSFFLLLLLVGIGNTGWAIGTTYYLVGDASSGLYFNDGSLWSSAGSGGSADGGTIVWNAADNMVIDSNSPAGAIIIFNDNLLISSLKISGGQTVTFWSEDLSFTALNYTLTLSSSTPLSIASGSRLFFSRAGNDADVPLTVSLKTGTGSLTGSIGSDYPGSTLDIQNGATLNATGQINGSNATNFFSNLVISGNLNTTSYVNVGVLNISSTGYFKTAYYGTSATKGWWHNSGSAPSSIVINGTVDYSRDNIQIIAATQYNNLVLSGATTTRVKKVYGDVTVTGTLTINSNNNLELNNSRLIFNGDISNNGTITNNLGLLHGSLKFNGSSAQSYYGTGTATMDTLIINSSYVGSVSLSSATNPLIADKVEFDNVANLDNGAKLTIGRGGATPSFITFNGNVSTTVGSILAPPIFNIGSGGLSINYLIESTGRVVANEMPTPTSLTATNMYISNTHGVTNTRDIDLTGNLSIATNASYDLVTYKTNRSASGGTLLVAGTMKLGGGTGGQTGSNFPTNFATMTMTGGTVEYNGSNAITQTVYAVPSYNNLVLTNSTGSGTAAKNLIANLTNTNFTINNGVQFTIPSGLTTTVGNNLVNNAGVDGLVLKSSGTASAGSLMVVGSLTGSGTVERKTDENRWYLISAPANQLIKDFVHFNDNIPVWSDDFSGKTDHYGMTSYNTGQNKYNNYYEEALNFDATTGLDRTTMLGFGKGYLIRTITDPSANQTITFKGDLKAGEQSVSLDQSGKLWNLIGNPYTSAIKLWDGTVSPSDGGASNFMDYNSDKIDPINFAAYIYNGSDYDVVNFATSPNVDYYSSIGQGFFIKAKAGASNALFEPAMQSHQVTTQYKTAVAPPAFPSIKLMATLNDAKVSTDIKFIEGTTKGLDRGYDAGIFKADPSFSLYTKLVDDIGYDFQLQCLPTNQPKEMVIPVGIDSKTGGDVIFSAETSNFVTGCMLVLEDKATNKFTDLSKSTYKALILAAADNSNRFYLHTSDIVSGLNDQTLTESNYKVYTIRGSEMQIAGEVGDKAVATLFNSVGQVVLTKQLTAGTLNIVGLPDLSSGVYMLNIKDKATIQTIKVLINNHN